MKIERVLLFTAACCISIPAIAVENISVRELLDRFAASREKLKSFIATTEVVAVQNPKSRQESERRYLIEFHYQDSNDNVQISYKCTKLEFQNEGEWILPNRFNSWLWNGTQGYEYYRSSVLSSSKLTFYSDFNYTQWTIGVMHDGAAPFLGIMYSDIERLDSILRKSKSISVRPGIEPVGLINCYVVDAESEHGTYTLWIDPKHDFGIAKAMVHKGPEHLVYGRPRNSYKSMSVIGHAEDYTIENVQFENIEGVWIPLEADYDIEIEKDDGIQSEHRHYKVVQIDLNPDHNDLGSFELDRLDIQNGTRIRVKGVPGIEYKWREGMKFVVDGWNGRIRYVPEEWSIRVRVGEPLPEFENIDSDFTAEDMKDKAILLCFFDMSQRPSRNCITQLAERARKLRERGVIVITVQASKADRDELDEWVKVSHIPFPVGMIQADVEKTRFAWGVRSLPWLILADKKHIVINEGLNLAELDEKFRIASNR